MTIPKPLPDKYKISTKQTHAHLNYILNMIWKLLIKIFQTNIVPSMIQIQMEKIYHNKKEIIYFSILNSISKNKILLKMIRKRKEAIQKKKNPDLDTPENQKLVGLDK